MRLVATVAALSVSLSALAQYPSKPIRLVVTFPPGGITDFTARALAPRLGEALRQPVIVENRTGSGGNIGTDFVAKAPPDGHTLLIAAPPNAINVSLYRSLPFDTKKDLAPVALVGSGANVLVVSAKTPVNGVRELVEHARRNPGRLNFASNGNGTSIHLSGELLKYYGKFDAVHVPFRGAPAAMAALLAGDVDFMFDALCRVGLSRVRGERLDRSHDHGRHACRRRRAPGSRAAQDPLRARADRRVREARHDGELRRRARIHSVPR